MVHIVLVNGIEYEVVLGGASTAALLDWFASPLKDVHVINHASGFLALRHSAVMAIEVLPEYDPLASLGVSCSGCVA